MLSSAVLRYASFLAHEPDISDAFDRKLLGSWPASTDLRDAVIQTRLYWGLFSSAKALWPSEANQPPLLALLVGVANERQHSAREC